MTPDDIARRIGIHPSTIWVWIEEGHIAAPGIRDQWTEAEAMRLSVYAWMRLDGWALGLAAHIVRALELELLAREDIWFLTDVPLGMGSKATIDLRPHRARLRAELPPIDRPEPTFPGEQRRRGTSARATRPAMPE